MSVNEVFNRVTPSELIEQAVVTYHAGGNVLVFGPPGVGKSEIAKDQVPPAIAASLGIPLSEFEVIWVPVAGMDAADARGLPDFDRKINRTIWVPPDILPSTQDVELGRRKEHGIIIFDEIDKANAATTAPLNQYMLNLPFASIQKPKGWMCFLTANRTKDGTGSNKIATQIVNRATVFGLQESVDDFVAWGAMATPHGGTRVRQEILHYHKRSSGDALLDFDPKKDVNATPRSWTQLSRAMDAMEQTNTMHLLVKHAVGLLGDKHGPKFVTFMDKVKKIWSIQKLTKDPMKAPVFDESGDAGLANFAMSYYANRTDDSNIDAVLKYVERYGADEWKAWFVKELGIQKGSRFDAHKGFKALKNRVAPESK